MIDMRYGDLMTIEQYKDLVIAKCLTPYDGYGFYCTKTEESSVPSEFTVKDIDTAKRCGFEYVMWYNK